MFGQTDREEAELDRVLNLIDQPYNVDTARMLLGETNEVMKMLDVIFFLRQGTCLGAVRDGDLLPWDDDIDIGSIYGLHGFSEDMIEPVIDEMKKYEFLVRITIDNDFCECITFVKESMRVDWACYRIINDYIYMYPANPIPVGLFGNLKEIPLLGEKYLVPNPPEEYLRLKYGDDWRIPKQPGEYESDVLDIINNTISEKHSLLFNQLETELDTTETNTTICILHQNQEPWSSAELFIAGIGRFKSDKNGEVNLCLPRRDYYAIKITADDNEYILYSEQLYPGEIYTFRQGDKHFTTALD